MSIVLALQLLLLLLPALGVATTFEQEPVTTLACIPETNAEDDFLHGPLAIAFFGDRESRKDDLVGILAQDPDLVLAPDSPMLVDSLQHDNGHALPMINFPGFGELSLTELRTQIVNFHILHREFAQQVPVGRLYYVTSAKCNPHVLQTGLAFLRSLYGVHAASQIRFLVILDNPDIDLDHCEQTLVSCYNEIFPQHDIPPAMLLNSFMNIWVLLDDILDMCKERPQLFLNPHMSHSTDLNLSQGYSTEVYDVEENFIMMPMELVGALRPLCKYADICLQEHSEGDLVQARYDLQLLADICYETEDGLAVAEEFYHQLNISDLSTRRDALQRLSMLGIQDTVRNQILGNCHAAVKDDLLVLSHLSSEAVRQYLLNIFPEPDSPHSRILLQYALSDSETLEDWQVENLLQASNAASLVDLIDAYVRHCTQCLRYINWPALYRTILRQAAHIDRASGAFVNVLLEVVRRQIALLSCIAKPEDSEEPESWTCADRHHLRTLLRLTARLSADMPEYLNDVTSYPVYHLVRILSNPIMNDVCNDADFIADLCPLLIRMVNVSSPEMICGAAVDADGAHLDSLVFPICNMQRNQSNLLSNAKFQDLVWAVMKAAFPHSDSRLDFIRRHLCTDPQSLGSLSAEIVLLGLENDEVFDLITSTCLEICSWFYQIKTQYYEEFLIDTCRLLHREHPQLAQEWLDVTSEPQLLVGEPGHHFAFISLVILFQSPPQFVNHNCNILHHILDRTPELVRDHHDYVRPVLRMLEPDSIPAVFSSLLKAGADGMALFRSLCSNLSDQTLANVRRSVQCVVKPHSWVELFQSKSVADSASMGLDQHVAEWISVMRMLGFAADLDNVPLAYLELLLELSPSDIRDQDVDFYIQLYWRLLKLNVDLNWRQRPLTNFILQHSSVDFFVRLSTLTYSQEEAASDQRSQRVEFCTQMLLCLIQNNPVKGRDVFRRNDPGSNLLGPALRGLLQRISSDLHLAPETRDGIGAQIISVLAAIRNYAEHKCWKYWLLLMLPESERFPLSSITTGTLALDAFALAPALDILALHPKWLFGLIQRAPVTDFNRMERSRSIFGEMLFRLAPRLVDVSVLRYIVHQISRWSTILSADYNRRIQSELSDKMKAALETIIISKWSQKVITLCERDRQCLAALLLSTTQRGSVTTETLLKSLQLIARLLHLAIRPDVESVEHYVAHILCQLRLWVVANSPSPFWTLPEFSKFLSKYAKEIPNDEPCTSIDITEHESVETEPTPATDEPVGQARKQAKLQEPTKTKRQKPEPDTIAEAAGLKPESAPQTPAPEPVRPGPNSDTLRCCQHQEHSAAETTAAHSITASSSNQSSFHHSQQSCTGILLCILIPVGVGILLVLSAIYLYYKGNMFLFKAAARLGLSNCHQPTQTYLCPCLHCENCTILQ